MIRRRLSWKLALVMLAVSLVPLLGTGLLTLQLIERSILEQVRTSQGQQARAAAALVRDYLNDATNKLRSIVGLVDRSRNLEEQARHLNGLLEPRGIFLEAGSWKLGPTVEVMAQVQQKDYSNSQYASLGQRAALDINEAQRQGKFDNRSFNTRLNQFVSNPRNEDPIVAVARKGNLYVAEKPEIAGDFPGLAISLPVSSGTLLMANLDLRPLSQMFASLAGPGPRVIALLDRDSTLVASSRDPAALPGGIEHDWPVGHGGWKIVVREPQEAVLGPVREARLQAILGFGLACFMAVGLAAIFAGRVLRPVRALAATADRLGRGDFSARSGIEREDEIGQLARAFDRMAAAVQELDRLKGDFVAHVSHELRTPLTSAKVALANVQDGLAGKEALSRVQQDLDRLIRMVNELLDAARIEAGIELAKQPADLGALARAAAETLRPLARVPLEVTGRGETLPLDPARVQQIVINLVDNALKYAKSRVDVTVSGREVRVTDDGPGVPPDLRERIFEKFGRAETGAKPPGAGLGLSIARKLARLHGGSLNCEGNTFVLRL